jgi:hypothetical protein
MYNSDTPLRAELPSSRQLLRSTILAAIAALVLLVAVVLPAEYGIDPTGVGRVLGITKMGDIKRQLAAEAAADAAATAQATKSPPTGSSGLAAANAAEPAAKAAVVAVPKEPGQAVAPKIEWRDEMSVTPGEGTEIKMKLVEGAKAQYSWVVEGGTVNFDTHGDAPGKSISYENGRGVPSDEGVLEAAFTGNHGWYWRNRGKANVKLILRTRGEYTDIKKMM